MLKKVDVAFSRRSIISEHALQFNVKNDKKQIHSHEFLLCNSPFSKGAEIKNKSKKNSHAITI